MYVFKIVPFLNPDGVVNGHYRSDTLGQNLNRVYISPNIQTQPSIYAVRKLIKYYHDKSSIDSPDTNSSEIESFETTKSENSQPNIFSSQENIYVEDVINSNVSDSNMINVKASCSSTKNFCEKFIVESGLPNQSELHPSKIIAERKNTIITPLTDNVASCSNSRISSIPIRYKPKHKLFSEKIEKKKSTISLASSLNTVLNSKVKMSNRNRFSRNVVDKMEKCDQLNSIQEKSDIILYMDLHGHASKKGIFMYGNYLPNVAEAVECMLLPRLMSINCQHFHFDACVFSERNMYLKQVYCFSFFIILNIYINFVQILVYSINRGKRDGLSKEGSGRVALYKAIGLIKCYTLESNYNTGKYVNVLPLAKNVKNEKKLKLIPPKYTPAIYEEVGKALLPSILDLTDSNPASRLRNSEFRSLNGLRDSLRNEALKLLEPRNISSQKVSYCYCSQ